MIGALENIAESNEPNPTYLLPDNIRIADHVFASAAEHTP